MTETPQKAAPPKELPLEGAASYFPKLTDKQKEQYQEMEGLYRSWNEKINVISRRDIDHLFEHHILHSLAIAKYTTFRPGTKVMDVGTGGGFPGLPLAVMFPDVTFHLIDSIGKKIRVASDIAASIGLKNVTFAHENVKEERGRFHFVVSRAVMTADELVRLVRKNIASKDIGGLPNGIICLKGGDLTEETAHLGKNFEVASLSGWFKEEYFETKKLLYIPIH